LQKEIIINSRKFDGKIHRSWKAELLEETDSLLTFVGKFENEVKHPHLGIIRRGTISYEYYWKNEWFNVFRFHEPEGGLRNYYCNINKPPIFGNGVLDYIDLEIDILVWKDFKIQILDIEEFEENAEKFGFTKDLRDKTEQSLEKILSLIKKKEFPFNTGHLS
jgi:protein associated with RNAse G/E